MDDIQKEILPTKSQPSNKADNKKELKISKRNSFFHTIDGTRYDMQ
jgi:hypothetical protein